MGDSPVRLLQDVLMGFVAFSLWAKNYYEVVVAIYYGLQALIFAGLVKGKEGYELCSS